jgi:hypothetical protein
LLPKLQKQSVYAPVERDEPTFNSPDWGAVRAVWVMRPQASVSTVTPLITFCEKAKDEHEKYSTQVAKEE